MADNGDHGWTLPALARYVDAQLEAQEKAVKIALDALNMGRSQTGAARAEIMAIAALLIAVLTAILNWTHH